MGTNNWSKADASSLRSGAAIKANPSEGGDAKPKGLYLLWERQPGYRIARCEEVLVDV
jgi:hypothetical protein